MKEESVTHPGKPLHWHRDQLGKKGSFRDWEESAAASSQKAEPAQKVCATSLHAPLAGTGPALAAVGFVDAWRLGQGLGCFFSSHSGSRCATTGSWYLTSVDLCLWICAGGFVNTTPEGNQGRLLAFPQLRRA